MLARYLELGYGVEKARLTYVVDLESLLYGAGYKMRLSEPLDGKRDCITEETDSSERVEHMGRIVLGHDASTPVKTGMKRKFAHGGDRSFSSFLSEGFRGTRGHSLWAYSGQSSVCCSLPKKNSLVSLLFRPI